MVRIAIRIVAALFWSAHGARNGAGVASSFGIVNRAIVPNPGAGLQAWATPASQATERKMNASSIVKPHSSTRNFAASSEQSFSASSYASAVACGTHALSSSVTGHVACLPLRRSKRMSTSPAISTPVKQISPSPIAACMSPTANIPPSCRTGKEMGAPFPGRWSSRLPPWRPARPFVSVSPSVATPTTPTIGFAGKRTRSFISIQPFFTRNMRVTGDSTCSISCPKPGIRHAKPTSIGRTSRISATTESPGSAPRIATGPVALLTRSKSISVTRSCSDVICPVKQSFVSNVTVSPGSTSSTGWRSGPNDQITWSRDRRCDCAIRDGFVFDVDAVHVAQLVRLRGHEPERDDDPYADPAERDPVRVLNRVGPRELDVLVVEREHEQHCAGNRHEEVQEPVELGSPLRPIVPDAAEAEQDVHDHDDDHGKRRDEREADQRSALPAEQDRQHEREHAHADDRDVGRPELRVDVPKRTRREAVAGQRIEHPCRRVHRRVRVRHDRVADREEHDDPACAPEDLAEVPPRVGAGRLGDEVVEPRAEDPGEGADDVEDADQER